VIKFTAGHTAKDVLSCKKCRSSRTAGVSAGSFERKSPQLQSECAAHRAKLMQRTAGVPPALTITNLATRNSRERTTGQNHGGVSDAAMKCPRYLARLTAFSNVCRLFQKSAHKSPTRFTRATIVSIVQESARNLLVNSFDETGADTATEATGRAE
jgi:hypothetical protein